MAKNYEEYQYYGKKYDKDLKEVTKLRDEAREGRIEEIETVGNDSEAKEAQRVLDGFDDEWNMDEVDKTKVLDLVK
ncbi:MAG: hypothetical protein MZV63_15680 [Marinilabiliales bacterium]|nr:hypothetical protein [Marinilabiliales bacterium]